MILNFFIVSYVAKNGLFVTFKNQFFDRLILRQLFFPLKKSLEKLQTIVSCETFKNWEHFGYIPTGKFFTHELQYN